MANISRPSDLSLISLMVWVTLLNCSNFSDMLLFFRIFYFVFLSIVPIIPFMMASSDGSIR